MSTDGRRRLARLLGLCLALTTLAPAGSLAGDRGHLSPTAKANPWGNPTPSQRLEHFAERKRFQSRVGLLNTARDAERSLAERRLRRGGTPAELASYHRRIAREDADDDLRLRADLGGPAGWWRSLGPATRRVFLQSGLDLRRTTREADRETRLDALAQEVERRESDAEGPFAPVELP